MRRAEIQHTVGRPEGSILLGRPRRIWADNIKTDLQYVRFEVWSAIYWLRMESVRPVTSLRDLICKGTAGWPLASQAEYCRMQFHMMLKYKLSIIMSQF
jgi:hypothetical protein